MLFSESMFMTVVCDVQDQFRKRTGAYKCQWEQNTCVESRWAVYKPHCRLGSSACRPGLRASPQSNWVRIPEVGPRWVPTWFLWEAQVGWWSSDIEPISLDTWHLDRWLVLLAMASPPQGALQHISMRVAYHANRDQGGNVNEGHEPAVSEADISDQ